MKQHQKSLSLETLGALSNGEAAATINAAIRAAIRDVEDRGDDKKPRKVTIEIEFKKFGESNVVTHVRAKTAVPPYQTNPTIGELAIDPAGRPEMAFSPGSSDNPDQPELPLGE